jgi:16S rRNA (uracil1498-N3)-methyltransferase
LGEQVIVVDGCGERVQGPVVEVRRDGLVIGVEARATEPAPRPRLTVVQALAKGDRGERAVEAMTEVGVDEIVPWAAARSIVEWRGDRGTKALERWRSVSREAAKQSRRSWFPVVSDQVATAAVVARVSAASLAIVCHESATEPLASIDLASANDVVLVVGPEGGLSDDELTVFVDAGARACRLGETVLRTSTAGVVAAAVVLARTRWSAG